MTKIHPEKLAYWYFRLNGCLTIENFVVHPDWRRGQQTEIDLIAVRFPHRSELLNKSMIDDQKIFSDPSRIRIIFAEVKKGTCNLNRTLENRQLKNMQRILQALGAFKLSRTNTVANSLYGNGVYKDSTYHVSILLVGSNENKELKKKYPEVPQLTWEEILKFIFLRFQKYKNQKLSHSQWDDVGQLLWNRAMEFNDFDGFKNSIEVQT